MKTNLKLSFVDGEYKLVNVLDFDAPQINESSIIKHRNDFLKIVSTTGISLLKDRMEECRSRLLKAAEEQKIVSEDFYAIYYKEGEEIHHFSKAAYGMMEEFINKQQFVFEDITPFIAIQLLKASVNHINEYLHYNDAKLFVDMLCEIAFCNKQ